VAWHERRGYAPDEIVCLFPGLTLAGVHAALAYYFNNRAEILNDIATDESLSRQAAEAQPSMLGERTDG
jgi:hypothetical protein